jgi:hypothetical protein
MKYGFKSLICVSIAILANVICSNGKIAYGDGSCGYVGNNLCHYREGCGQTGCGPNCQQYKYAIEAMILPDMWIVSDDGPYAGAYQDSSQLRMNCWRYFACQDALDSVCDISSLPPTCVEDPKTYGEWVSVSHISVSNWCQ